MQEEPDGPQDGGDGSVGAPLSPDVAAPATDPTAPAGGSAGSTSRPPLRLVTDEEVHRTPTGYDYLEPRDRAVPDWHVLRSTAGLVLTRENLRRFGPAVAGALVAGAVTLGILRRR